MNKGVILLPVWQSIPLLKAEPDSMCVYEEGLQ